MLNSRQSKAIKHKNGPLLIIAGAGTGKTTVITERIKHLIVDRQISSSNVLALTFTEKAAFEMQERIDILLPYGYTNMWVNTFHSFCDRILRDEAHTIGLDTGYKLLTESESVLLLQENIFELGLKQFKPLGNPTKFLNSLLTHFSRLKDEDITPDEYIAWAQNQSDSDEKQQYLELATAYKKYEEVKIKNSAMDFSDLISNTLRLFRTRNNVLKKYQKIFQFILVDEFQDTNYAQNELAILLSGDDKNITVVADDDQSIYRFRGAAVSNVMQFKKNFPQSSVITLIDNYRSTQVILDAAYSLIQNNNPNRLEIVESIDKKLKSHSKSKQHPIELICESRADDEAENIAKKILELTKKNYDFKDVAILVRANNHALPITASLARHRIPYQFLGPGYLFQQDEIKDLIAYLTFLTNLNDSISLFRVLSMEIFDIPYVQLNFLLNYAKKNNLTLFESLIDLNQSFLTEDTKAKLDRFRQMSEKHLLKSKKTGAGQILYDFLLDSGLFQTLNKTDSLQEERRVQNIAKFFDRVKNFESERPDSNIFTLADWLSLMMQLGDSPTAADIDIKDRDAVNILTVHSSKGLEFDVVFMVNLVNDRFPSRERAEKIPLPQALLKENLEANQNFHIEEERRLFYVGMTRARERLFFTSAEFYGTGKRAKKISPFVFEANPKLEKAIAKKDNIKQLTLSDVLSSFEAKEEVHEEKPPLKLTYITYSNLQTFDICPLHYKAQVILRLPTPTAAVQSFGISLHNTLYNFYRKVQEGMTPTFKELKSELEKEWISEGYINKTHERERYEQGLRIIEEFYEREGKNPTSPLSLEMPFSFMLKNGVKVFGKIDRIDKTKNGIEIIDYKTGEDNPKADKSHKLQLEMYALAATRVKDEILNRKPEDITLSLQFLEGNTKKTMSFTKDDLDRLENDLVEKIEEIENSDFKCSGNILCKNCEFKILCNAN